MKITDRMVGDHKTFRKMMTEIDTIATTYINDEIFNRRLIRLVELFVDHLMIHAWGEETFYYPAVRKAIEKASDLSETTKCMDSLDEEHKAIDATLLRLEEEVKKFASGKQWPQIYATFTQGLITHMKKEEEELFPLSEKLLGEEQLEKLSLELERHRAEAPKARSHLRLDK